MTKAIGFSPHKKQKEIIDGVLGDNTKHHIVSVGRQFGKSLMGINLLLYWAINNKPCKILWCSPTYSQTNKVQKEIDNAIRHTDIIRTCNYSESYIGLRNGSEIYFRSSERYDNIRGFTFDYAILDESAFMRREVWFEAIRPTLAVRGKKVLFLSTPKGRNWFYDIFELGNSVDYNNYRSYQGTSLDTPYISKEEIDDASKTLPPNVFKQEYMAEFIDDGGEVFSNISDNTFAQYPKPQGQLYCGIDLGRQNDFSVATIIDSAGNVIDIYRNNKQQWADLVNDLTSFIRKYNATTLIEVNSIGDVVYEQIKSKYNNINAFVTTNKTKQEIIEGLILDMNEKSVMIPSKELFQPLYDELGYFTYEYNPKTRSVKYGHPTGLHDDCVISLALANYCRKTQSTRGQYNWVV
jgi:hypothetical protein